MKARYRALAPALVALAAAVFASPAMAAERLCPAPTLEADAAFAARHGDLLELIRTEFSTRTDLDPCARVDLSAGSGDAVEVSVTLRDGRRASRMASGREDVLPTLHALLLVPMAATASAPTKARRARRATRVAPQRTVNLAPLERDSGVTPREARSLGIELSLLGGARLGEGQVAFGGGAISLLEAQGWLGGFSGRAHRYRTRSVGQTDPPIDDAQLALELGVLAGKRFYFRGLALDVLAGPALAMMGFGGSSRQEVRFESRSPAPPQPVPETPSVGPVPRLLLGAHAGFSPRLVLRSFVGVEASFGPSHGSDSSVPRTTGFPVFSVGVVLGGTVGTR